MASLTFWDIGACNCGGCNCGPCTIAFGTTLHVAVAGFGSAGMTLTPPCSWATACLTIGGFGIHGVEVSATCSGGSMNFTAETFVENTCATLVHTFTGTLHADGTFTGTGMTLNSFTCSPLNIAMTDSDGRTYTFTL